MRRLFGSRGARRVSLLVSLVLVAVAVVGAVAYTYGPFKKSLVTTSSSTNSGGSSVSEPNAPPFLGAGPRRLTLPAPPVGVALLNPLPVQTTEAPPAEPPKAAPEPAPKPAAPKRPAAAARPAKPPSAPKMQEVIDRVLATTSCTYEDGKTWKNWGGAPFGKNAEDSLSDAKLDWMLKCSSIPERLHAKLKAKVRAFPKGERTTYLTPETVVREMSSGPDAKHRSQFILRGIKVAEIMVAFGIAQSAKAFVWEVEDEDGTVYRFAHILICNNLAVLGERTTPCVRVLFNAPVGGHVSWRLASKVGPLPRDKERSCNFQRQGDGAEYSFYGECPGCPLPLEYARYIERKLGEGAEIPHNFKYEVKERRQLLSFSPEVWNMVLGICLEYPDGKKTCSSNVSPQLWRREENGNGYLVDILDSQWKMDEGDCLP